MRKWVFVSWYDARAIALLKQKYLSDRAYYEYFMWGGKFLCCLIFSLVLRENRKVNWIVLSLFFFGILNLFDDFLGETNTMVGNEKNGFEKRFFCLLTFDMGQALILRWFFVNWRGNSFEWSKTLSMSDAHRDF